VFLAAHDKITEKKSKQLEKKSTGQRKYSLTRRLLKKEIRAPKADNLSLRIRGKTQRIGRNSANQELWISLGENKKR
jgi:hypothetical protein